MIIHSIFLLFFNYSYFFPLLMVITSRSTINSVFFSNIRFYFSGVFVYYGWRRIFRNDTTNRLCRSSCSFLFVVMMLNVAEQKQSWFIGKKSTHIPTGLIVSVLILLELLVVVGGWKYKKDIMSSGNLVLSEVSNTHQLGLVMYTDYILYFQLAGIVLLLAMIGAILLTFRERIGVKKQSYINQITRSPETAIELRDVKSNQGVKIDD